MCGLYMYITMYYLNYLYAFNSNNCIYYLNAGATVIEGPANVTFLPGLTPLPIKMTCQINGTENNCD